MFFHALHPLTGEAGVRPEDGAHCREITTFRSHIHPIATYPMYVDFLPLADANTRTSDRLPPEVKKPKRITPPSPFCQKSL